MQNSKNRRFIPVRILIVDDDQDNVDTLGRLLRSMGHDVLTLMRAKTAILIVPAFRPELMLVDLAMPHFDGCELIRQLRGDNTHSEISVVAMSGYADPAHRQMAFDAGCDDFLVKPFDVVDLKALIDNRDLIRKHSKETK